MKIAILATEYLKSYLEDAVKTLDLGCETEIFIYYNYVHIVELYRQLENQFDGFITTGPVPMQTVKKSVENCKPISFFLCSDSNYYKIFFEMIYKYQDWNFEYGYFDFCDYLCPGQESSLISYLENGNFNKWLDKNNQYMAEMSVEQMQDSTRKKLEKHIDYWKSGKIKYSLSRMSPIMPQILEAGVNCYYISFSHDDIKTCFEQLTHSILINQVKDNQPAAIDITLPAYDKTDEASWSEFQNRYEILEKLILAFNKKYFCDFIIRDTRYGFRIWTNYKTTAKITKDFTACYVRDYIREKGEFDVFIGYGLGAGLVQAETNAADAGKESKISGGRHSYLMNEQRDLTGLFGDGRDFSIQSDVTPYMYEISQCTGLSTLTIQKLFSALRITGTEEVTTQDLSRVLHITIRSVNRMISALVKYNLAKEQYTRQNNTKGRPSKVYKILLEVADRP